jgi:TrmH family RNA methyltransferase
MPTKAEISFVRSLADKRTREQHGLFVVEGPKMVAEALASGWRVRNIYNVEDGVPPRDLERMSSLRTPQGVLAVVEMRDVPATAAGPTLALDGIQDPGNLGTIMRTADWFGIRRIVCSPDCADRFNPKAVQASMGAIFRIPVTYGELLFPAGTPVYGAFLDGESIYNTSFAPDAVVLLGSEGRGISAAAAAHVTHRITIPSFSPRAESLNVAAAAAIICSELRGARVRF